MTSLRDDGIVDAFAVERAITGSGAPVTLTTRERHQAVRTLIVQGVPYQEIARRCRVTIETVRRDRQMLGLMAGR